MPPRKGNGCSPQFPRDSVAAALAPPPLLKLTPHPLQGGHTLLPFHRIHRPPSKLLAQTMLSQGSSSFHACLPERHAPLPVTSVTCVRVASGTTSKAYRDKTQAINFSIDFRLIFPCFSVEFVIMVGNTLIDFVREWNKVGGGLILAAYE